MTPTPANDLAFDRAGTGAATDGAAVGRSATPEVPLPDELVALLRGAATCYVSTLMPDGSPQMTQTWADTDGRHVIINTVVGSQKAENVARDPRVALTISPPDNPSRYFEVRGHITAATTDGAAAHIDVLAQRYLGTSYPWYGGRRQQRLVLAVTPNRINVMG